MPLIPTCPRCGEPALEKGNAWQCLVHGPVPPLWSPEAPDYDTLIEHLERAGDLPTWLPWPLGAGGAVTDFGTVAGPSASFATCTFMSEIEGLVEITVVTEEPGVGLGARCAGVPDWHPSPELRLRPREATVRIDGHPIALWSVSTTPDSAPAPDDSPAGADPLDRSVFVGEAGGRWLWVVMRPASAALLLLDDWSLQDLGSLGHGLLDLPFRSVPRGW